MEPEQDPAGVVWFDTASGSRYRLDFAAWRWDRLAHDPRSDEVRTDGGQMERILWPLTIGRRCVILGPSLSFEGGVRSVETTPVTAIYSDDPEGTPIAASWWDDQLGSWAGRNH